MAFPSAAPKPAPRKKIAYIKRGIFSHSNIRTGEQLRARFPEFEVEELDVVKELLQAHPWIVLVNLFAIVRRYWRQILCRRQSVHTAFYRTPYIFGKIRDLVRSRIQPRMHEFAFSIQTQSLYDASTPGLPHFVFTDHTHLVNLSYPGFDPARLSHPDWIDREQEIYRHARHLFVMSEHVRQSLIDQYALDPDRITSIGAGSNVDMDPIAADNNGYANKTILFVGIDWERKGGPNLLAAFERVVAEEPEARLVIVGCEPAVSHPRIEVVGRVSREDVKTRMSQASIFCLPTRIEPFGIVVVEAFHHGLPVVATRLGALPDLVEEGKTGYLVQPDNSAALAGALLKLVRDPEQCRRFGEQGRAFAQAHYTWDAVGQKLRDGIEQSLQRTAPAPA